MRKNDSFLQYVSNLMCGIFRFHVTPERLKEVYDSIADGSQPESRFYIMVVVSTLIAGFGLLTNSTAVVIGAMLVAPLMTPIFGISLAMVREDTGLFRRAARAEILGMAAAVAMGFVVGWLLVSMDPYAGFTQEMLSRTKPNLEDLAVAVLAGLAGAYALIDEKISPALPGVAIATAIVPPLANCGLCLAFKAYSGALGSFLLFFTNFISILLVSSILFYKSGMARSFDTHTPAKVFRKFGLAVIGFIAMVGFMVHSLVRITEERDVEHTVKKHLTVEFANYATTGIDKLLTNVRDGTVHALAQIMTPGGLTTDNVKRMEDQLAEKLEMPVKLIVREISASDVSSRGSDVALINHSLDGFFVDKQLRPEVRVVQTAEEVIMDYTKANPDLHLVEADAFTLNNATVVVGKITGFRRLATDEISMLESRIRDKAKEPGLKLIMRFQELDLLTDTGDLLYGWRTVIKTTDAQRAVMDSLVRTLKARFENNDHLLLDSVHKVIGKDGYELMAELRGLGPFDSKDLRGLRDDLASMADKQVTLYAWINRGPVMTVDGLVSFAQLNETRKQKAGKMEEELVEKILKRIR